MKVGDKVPDMLGVNQDGKELRVSDYKGKRLALYFYPKDNTSGCTAQACSLRDSYGELLKAGFSVVGVSINSAASHQKFIAKNELPFDLIVDEEHRLADTFGVWGEKKMCGKTYMGMFRTTFIIDAESGVVERIMTPKQVKTKEHGAQLLGL
ncbi:MAG: thioredoxin-dependent thiol peroxidase [Rikenellaceae bacterium]